MGFLGLFGSKGDPVREQAGKWGKVLVEYRRGNPEGALREAVLPLQGSLWKLMKKPGQRGGMDFILSEKYQEKSVQEFCCALVALATDTPMGAERYKELEAVVKEELGKLG